MLNANIRKFTSCGDKEADMLLEKVLSGLKETLSGTGLCVVLGGSYGRGEGGVRSDRDNGILYNDLDFFVFADKKDRNAGKILEAVAEKYEQELQVDIDFSQPFSISGIKRNAGRLMFQELKRGYHLVCGNDFLAEYLPEIPAEKISFSEACRLMLNRGMGLLLAAEKIAENSGETDFILRNINKAILGACDAVLLAGGTYCWRIKERENAVMELPVPEEWKKLYTYAVKFKESPCRDIPHNIQTLWLAVRDMFLGCMNIVCGEELKNICTLCRRSREVSFINFIRYCVKTGTFPVWKIKKYYCLSKTCM